MSIIRRGKTIRIRDWDGTKPIACIMHICIWTDMISYLIYKYKFIYFNKLIQLLLFVNIISTTYNK
jgi:hypothetical protein